MPFKQRFPQLPVGPGYIPVAVAVAEDENGEIKGVHFVQLAMHMEPLVIDDKRVSFLRLAQELDKELGSAGAVGYYVFSDGDKVDKMAQMNGMEAQFNRVWYKNIAPEPQAVEA